LLLEIPKNHSLELRDKNTGRGKSVDRRVSLRGADDRQQEEVMVNTGLKFSIAEARSADTASDVDLICAAQSGDPMAFSELWRRYSRKMFATIVKITRNYEDAEDALQESFLKAYMHLRDFRGNARFSSWMTSIAINSALMSLRKRKTRPTLSIDSCDPDHSVDYREPASGEPGAEELCIRQQQVRNVRDAVTRLHAPLRGVIEIHVAQGAGVDETAAMAGISLSAAKSRLMRAKNEIRRSMRMRCQL
jgi:RNA polymerase sigma-70 factor (ECF subfamily)